MPSPTFTEQAKEAMSLYATVLVDPGYHGDFPTPQLVRIQSWHSGMLQRLAFEGLGVFNFKEDAEALKAEYEARFPDAAYAVVDGGKVLEKLTIYKIKDSFNPNDLMETISGTEVESLEFWAGEKS